MQFSFFIKSHQSIGRQASIVKHWLLPLLGNCRLEDIGPQRVSAFLEEVRESGASDAHIRSVLCCLRSYMREAVRERLIFSDPTEDFQVKVRKSQVMALSAAQRDVLDAELLRGLHARTAALVLRVILWTGLRIGEALALQFNDFDAATGTLTVRSGKSDAAARRVDVPDCVVGTLTDYLCAPFYDRPHETTLRRVLKEACFVANLPLVRVHDLRHTRITTQLVAGVPVGYVSKQAGHASAATTLDIYDQWVQIADHEQRRAWANA